MKYEIITYPRTISRRNTAHQLG